MSPNTTTISEVFVTLASPNVGRQVAFYRALLQADPEVNTPSYAEFRKAGLKVAIFQPSDDHVLEFTVKGSGAMSFCLEVDDLEGAIAHLTSLGYPPPGTVIDASHGQEIYAYDPDGNRLILHQSP